jgi:hypothetical protein
VIACGSEKRFGLVDTGKGLLEMKNRGKYKAELSGASSLPSVRPLFFAFNSQAALLLRVYQHKQTAAAAVG